MSMVVNSFRFSASPPPGASLPASLELLNPGAESGNASGWTAASGGVLWSSITTSYYPYPTAPHAGSRYFAGGDVANARMYQDVDVSDYATVIDSTGVVAELGLHFLTSELYLDSLSIFLRALDASNAIIETVAQEDLTTLDRSASGATWVFQDLNTLLPSGTRKVRVELHAARGGPNINNVFVDSINLTLYDHTRRITPTYGSPISRGNRTGLITITNNNLHAFGNVNTLIDGAITNSYFFNGIASTGNEWITFDFGSGNAYVVDEFIWKQQNTTGHGVWRLEGSNNNSSWTQIGSDFTLNGGMVKPGGANDTAYRYYRLRAMSGSRSASPYLYEIHFRAK